VRRFGILGYIVLICLVVALAARTTYLRHRLTRLESQAQTQEDRLGAVERSLAELAARPPVTVIEHSDASPAAVDTETATAEEDTAIPEDVAADTDDPTEADVRFYIATGFEEYFPDRQLSEQNVQDAASAIMNMRSHRDAMRALEMTRENAEEFRQHREAVHRSWEEFERATGVSMTKFLATVSVKGESNDDALDQEPVFEYLSDYQP